jgi:hypothetical protein
MTRFPAIALVALMFSLLPSAASAHCDALDGPVVAAARAALDRNDVTPALRWVAPAHEAEVRAAFDRVAAVRAAGGEARALADTWFFETLVRIHRAGEGAPFDGLKPAGHIEPFVAAVDQSFVAGAPDDVIAAVSAHVASGVRERFDRAREARAHADDSVEAGRTYVAAYVDYLHYVEALHRAAPAAEHHESPEGSHAHQP